MNRLMWPLGILLLVGSLVGAGWVLNHTAPDPSTEGKSNDHSHEPLSEVFCLGMVDVEKGVTDLYPKQPGEVAEIADAQTTDKAGLEVRERVFKKGDVLLRLKSEMAEYQLGKAKAALRAAENELTRARQLAPEHKLKIQIQQATLAAYGHEKKKLKADLDSKLSTFKENIGNPSKNMVTAMQEAIGAIDERMKVEEGQLERLKLFDPELEVSQVEASVDAKRLDVKIAEQALKDFQLEAPFDGIILRVHTRVGEPLGPNPKVPAIEFCPVGPDAPKIVRAEVIQEWGHRVHVGQEANIEDDTYMGPQWTGRVKSLSPWYAPKRIRIVEPFMNNDVRTLECIVEFTGGQSPVRIGQRMRVKIKI